MRIFTKLLLAAALPMTALPVSAKVNSPINLDAHRYAFKSTKHQNGINSPRMQRINQINKMMETGASRFNLKTRAELQKDPAPDMNQGPANAYGTVDGPNDKMWFYTITYDTRVIPHYSDTEKYTEYVQKAYTIKIFDEKMNFVGQIFDKVRYNDNEVRTPACDIVPVITQKFFNDDNNYEIMVGIVFNTKEAGYNTERTYVYSMGGEKETLPVDDVTKPEGTTIDKQCDKPIYVFNESIGDVLDASHDGQEIFYITTYGETLPPDTEYDEDMTLDEIQKQYWEQLTSSNINFQMYAKAGADGKPQPVGERIAIPILALPGNQDNSPFMLTYTHDNKPYLMVQRYKEIFWNPYYSMTDDLTMRESNSLVVDLYRLDGTTMTNEQHTEIAFTKDPELLANYYSVGDFRYRKDINYGDFSADGRAAFYITKINQIHAESEDYSFYIYNADGKCLKTLYENCEYTLELSDVEGFEPQQLFIELYGTEYYLTFVDLISAKQSSQFSYRIDMGEDSDPETITTNMDRVAFGDSYAYVSEMRNPIIGDNDEDITRIAWLNRNGTLHHIDEVIMGTSIHYAQTWIAGAMLNPTLFDEDPDDYEYVVLVKQGIEVDESDPEATNKTENVIVAKARSQKYPDGHIYLTVGQDDRGQLQDIQVYPDSDNPYLFITHYDVLNTVHHIDFWFLPFFVERSAIEDIEAGATVAGISFDGTTITAPDQEIKVYSINGVVSANGFETVSVENLTPGIYVAVAGTKAVKFVIK